MNTSNPQDPKEPTSYQKEPAKTDETNCEYSEGVDDLTIRFLKTKQSTRKLFKIASQEISMRFFTASDRNMLSKAEERDDESDSDESEYGGRNMPSKINEVDEESNSGEIEDEEKVSNVGGYQTIKDEKEKWYEQEPDETLEEMMTVGTLVVAVGFLAGCGFLGYCFLIWFG